MADEQFTFEEMNLVAARMEGLPFYFTGKPCKSGHVALRHTCNRTCVECAKDHDRKQKETHRETLRERDRVKYWNNPKRFRAKTHIWRTLNLERALIATREWRENNKDRRKEYQAKWCLENPGSGAFHRNKRRAAARGAEGTHTPQDITDLYTAQKGRCAYCKAKVGKKYHVDHIQPLAKGGRNDKGNLQICCPICNLRKHAKDPIDFAQELGLLI